MIDRFEKLYSGVIYDAIHFDLCVKRPFLIHHDVKPQWISGREPVRFGYALTCRGETVSDAKHIDDTVRIDMFKSFYEGCFQVIATGGDRRVAHFGDISGKLAAKFGAVGVVTDGFTRDISILEEDAFPVYARGVKPVDAFGRWQIVEFECPVTLDGAEGDVDVFPGDGVFADRDSVMILPRDLIADILEKAEARLAREEDVRRELKNTDDIMALYERIGRW
ncbi:RraA family protein [Eilatimonas milleporae]|uniref:Putative 4-hydroxy-4-methyl-2-oxoglutarate aldolase n=1 Tax=Eilatimonas milleporae TaxID=911205 RepID=A0A3M0CNF2_9PROT|nr:hypothetical protein [Eilatimonas milleporae]RMB04783.1 demethylmenaquinone methyltransferase [Eilatimonas milleporae]